VAGDELVLDVPATSCSKRRASEKARMTTHGALQPEERPMADERPQMAASEIEEELLAELQKMPLGCMTLGPVVI
jgi:hypothetical protein